MENILRNLLEKQSEKLSQDVNYQKYLDLLNLISPFDRLSSDYSQLDYIYSRIDLLSDFIPDILVVLNTFKNLTDETFRNALNEEDIKNLAKKYKNAIINYIAENQELMNIKELFDNKNELEDIINNENYDSEFLLNFIEASYKKGFISLNEAVELNLWVAQKQKVRLPEETPQETEEEELAENTESIEESLSQIFNDYGFVFEKLNSIIKQGLNKYAKLDTVKMVLSALKEHNIKQKKLEELQKTIYDIIIFNDKEAFNENLEFVKNNDCPLEKMIILFPGSFRRVTRRNQIKSENAKKRPNGSHGTSTIPGSHDDFLSNCEILKKMLKKDKLIYKDFDRCKDFINTKHSLVLKNLNLLRAYKIVGPDEFPESTKALTGNYTQYHLDRFIETGQYDYIKNNNSYLSALKSPLKAYKLRRAADLGETLTRGRGFRSELTDDYKAYQGVYTLTHEIDGKKTKAIVQDQYLSNGSHLIDNIPDNRIKHRETYNYYSTSAKEQTFNKVYLYNSFETKDLFSSSILSKQKAKYVSDILESGSPNFSVYDENILEDPFIKQLDNWFQPINGEHHIKKNDLEYEFLYYPDNRNKNNTATIIISRIKVLRAASLLKENHYWIDDDNFDMVDIQNIITAVLLKDSTISIHEKEEMEFIAERLEDFYSRKYKNRHSSYRGGL